MVENNSFDSRSDDKGPEPEGVTTGVINDRTYAFIGLERIGGVLTYDVTDPTNPKFIQYINNRDFSVEFDPEAATSGESDAWRKAGDLGPEGLTFISAQDSPNGKPLLAVANEVSGTTTLFEITNILNGSDAQNTFELSRDSDAYTITNFGGVGTGTKPSPEAIAQVDTLKFQGEGLTAENILLTQEGGDLVIGFEGIQDVEARLVNFDLEDLDNLPNGVSGAIGNILFNGQTEIQDSFDVANANQNLERVFNQDTVTFLNDLDNDTKGWDDSNDVINGQGGNDTLTGLSGDDILRGGDGNDILTGGDGMDQFWIASNALPKEVDTITDFQVGIDAIGIAGLPGVTGIDNLSITQSGADTLLNALDKDLAILTGIQANTLNSSSFALA
jgi:Ca2+-binding RTX toxin-like protein